MKDVDKKKNLEYNDFPPTTETEKLRIWDPKKLDIEPKNSKASLNLELTKEEVYESRCYAARGKPYMLLKVLSKRNKESGKITFIIKTTTAIFAPSNKKTFTEKEYEKAIKELEATLAIFYDIENPTIVSAEEFNRQFQPFIEKHGEELKGENDGGKKKNRHISGAP
jgi:hypothetical protein